jgi:phosphoserine phosphatase RsbU/P
MPQTINQIDWKSEMDKTILRYHSITSWVAIVFNLLFFATDLININEYWQPFLAFRASVSFVMLVVMLSYKKLKIPIELIGVLPVLLISIQNAYMWSVMDAEHLQKHTLAYMALFIGAGMLVLYRVYYSIFIIVSSIIANVIFFKINSSLTLDEIIVNGGLLTASVGIFSILLIRTRYSLTKKEIIARLSLEASNAALAQQKEIIETKNKEILDSINYAKRIQDALIPPPSVLKQVIPDSFCLFIPKDIVSGDFYWLQNLSFTPEKNEKLGENRLFFAVADCTGHGVSGAFVSIIGLKILNQAIKKRDINSPADILNYLNSEVYNTINLHTREDTVIRDGMDIALCSIHYPSLTLEYAGANNPVYIVRNKEIHEIKADKQPIGSYISDQSFTNKVYPLQKGDMVYVFSDGYADQFGGEKGKKFNYKQFKTLLEEISSTPIDEQKDTLLQAFSQWKGNLEQLDDVCIIGVRV